jgi:hypothetical protein
MSLNPKHVSGMEAKLGKRVMPLETWENAANAARFREREGGREGRRDLRMPVCV